MLDVRPPLAPEDLEHCLAHSGGALGELRGERVFVTGGTGFFGRWLVETFLRANRELALGARMTVLTRDARAFLASSPHLEREPALVFQEGDVRTFEAPSVRHAFFVHCATAASKALNDRAPLEMIDTVCAGTRRALDVATSMGCERFLNASSGAVYGRQPSSLSHVGEDFAGGPDPTDPANAYAESKRLAELLGSTYARAHGMAVVHARGFAFVGPHLPLDAHLAVGNFIRDALAGRAVVVEGDGTPYRSYLYAADLAVWLWTLLVRGETGRAYNVGSEDGRPLGEIAALVAGLVGTTVEVRKPADPGVAPLRYVPRTTLASAGLGLVTRVPLDEALRRTLAWYRPRFASP